MILESYPEYLGENQVAAYVDGDHATVQVIHTFHHPLILGLLSLRKNPPHTSLFLSLVVHRQVRLRLRAKNLKKTTTLIITNLLTALWNDTITVLFKDASMQFVKNR